MDRHQPPRILCGGVEIGDAFEHLLERGQGLRHLVELGLGRSGEQAARAVEVAVEALDHGAVGEVGRDVRLDQCALAAGKNQPRRDADREADRGEEAEHADRDDQSDADRGEADDTDGDCDPHQSLHHAAVEALEFAAAGVGRRARALVDPREDIVGAGGRHRNLGVGRPGALETVVGAVEDAGDILLVHLLSSGVNGDEAFSSRPWATPSARAI